VNLRNRYVWEGKKEEAWSRVCSRFLVAKAFSRFPRNPQFVGRVIPVWQTPIASANIGLNSWILTRMRTSLAERFWNSPFKVRKNVSLSWSWPSSLSELLGIEKIKMIPLKCLYLIEVMNYQRVFSLICYLYLNDIM